MDQQVLATQQWLNVTYGGAAGWVAISEDGITGWSTVYGLRRALQVELGVSPLSSAFGPGTTAAFKTQIGRIDNSTQRQNLLRLLGGALWCKGYPGLYFQGPATFGSIEPSVTSVRNDLGLGSADPHVDVKLMASLLSMDAYVELRSGAGAVREAQQWLNATYSTRRDFSLVPCDGVFSRQIQTALLYALQYEMGMADGTANGNFGPGTRDGLRTKAQVSLGSADTTKRFVQLYQAALRFNTYPLAFHGVFDGSTETATRVFQSFMELPVNGRGDYSTWCALLVSNGDTSISTRGFDTNQQLSYSEASGAVAAGYTTVGRYLVGANKYITATELEGLRNAGLLLLPIYQRYNNDPAHMTRTNGKAHGIEAIERCRVLGLPKDSSIVFAVDFDALGQTIEGPVCDYFQGVKDAMSTSLSTSYRVLVYGTRNVASVVIGRGLAEGAFVAGMSSGWSGNMGFPMPADWQYNQIVETSVIFPGSSRSIGIDKVVLSSRAEPASLTAVSPPPVELDGSSTATGFDAFFEWLVKAEVACERGLAEGGNWLRSLDHYVSFVDVYILHWLQKPLYWGDNWSGMWNVYTPMHHPDADTALAADAAEYELAKLSRPNSTRDIPHFAATLRGYSEWGLTRTRNDYGLGDLGGWALDLLSIWGVYLGKKAENASLNQEAWMTAELGALSGDGTFTWADVVADADAWLMKDAMETSGSNVLSAAARGLLKLTSRQRVGGFYATRFSSSKQNLQQAFLGVVDGIDAGSFENIFGTRDLLLRAARAPRLPTESEASICAGVYANFMAAQL